MKYYQHYRIDRFLITIVDEDGFITDVYASDGEEESALMTAEEQETEAILSLRKELESYFRGDLDTFRTPLNLRGTPFQRRVYHALIEIPFGKTASYKEIALRVGSPKGFRAVGQAVHNNPHLIVVPCHRIIGSDRSLTGFAGGLEMKQYLLDLEKRSS